MCWILDKSKLTIHIALLLEELQVHNVLHEGGGPRYMQITGIVTKLCYPFPLPIKYDSVAACHCPYRYMFFPLGP